MCLCMWWSSCVIRDSFVLLQATAETNYRDATALLLLVQLPLPSPCGKKQQDIVVRLSGNDNILK